MDLERYFGWCIVENTISNRLEDNSLVHTLSSKNHIRKSTKLINRELKKLSNIKTYSQYLKCKKKILEKITENTDVTDESDLSDDDYKKFYNSFEVYNKDESKNDVKEEGFQWLYIEKQGRKQSESELGNLYDDDPPLHILEPNIQITEFKDSSSSFEESPKTANQKRLNSLINDQPKVKNCKPCKTTAKLNVKTIVNASTCKTNNVDSELILKKITPSKEYIKKEKFVTKKSVNKSPKDFKKNLTSVINGVCSKITKASEDEEWNDEFISSEFQAQSTKIFSDTLPDATQGRKSVSKRRISGKEAANQPRDSGIEEDSREENASFDKRPDNKKLRSLQKTDNKEEENLTTKTDEKLKKNINSMKSSDGNNVRHKLPLKIIEETNLTTKYKIVKKQISKPRIINQKKEKLKEELETASKINDEYIDTQNKVNNFKQEIIKNSEVFDDLQDQKNGMDSNIETISNQNNSKIIKISENIDETRAKQLFKDHVQLFTDDSSDESSVTSETSKNINVNVKSDRSSDNESIMSDITNVDCKSYEIEPQKDIVDIVKNYKLSLLKDKSVKQDFELKESANIKITTDKDSDLSETERTPANSKLKERNINKEAMDLEQKQKQLSPIKKVDVDHVDVINKEESSESEDDKKNSPVKFILPIKKSDSEESEESEIENEPATVQYRKQDNEEEGYLSIHAERRLAKMKRFDFANCNDTEDSEEEENNLLTKNIKISELNSSENRKVDTKNDSELDLSKSDSSSDDEQKLENKDKILDIVKKPIMDNEEDTMSLQAKERLQKMKSFNFNNDSEDSNSSVNQKVEDNDNIDIKEHKIIMPDSCQELELINEDSSGTKIEKSSNSKKKKKLNDEKARKASQRENNSNSESLINKQIASAKSDTSEDHQDEDISSLIPEVSTQSINLNKVDLNKESVTEFDKDKHNIVLTQTHKVNKKLSDDKDDDSDSDRSLSPSTTHRLSQFKKMNLLEDNNSSSSSEDENNKKTENVSKRIDSQNFQTDDCHQEKAFELNPSKLSSTDDIKKSNTTCSKDNNRKKIKIADKDRFSKNIIISETQESDNTQENYVASQELFSSEEDVTAEQSKKWVLGDNNRNLTNEISSTPETTEIVREKVTNISQLVKKENLVPVTMESTMTCDDVSSDEEIFLLEVPKHIFSNDLIGEQFSFFKSSLKVGMNSYEAFKKKVSPTFSCIFQSKEDSYTITNVRPSVSIATRRKKFIDESDRPISQEQVKCTESELEFEKNDDLKTKKKTKKKDTDDTKETNMSNKIKLLDTKIEHEDKNKSLKKKDITFSPAKVKKLNNENSKDLFSANDNRKKNMDGSPKKTQKLDKTVNKENIIATQKQEKKSKANCSLVLSSKIKNKGKNKFRISRFILNTNKSTKIDGKKIQEPKFVQLNDNMNLKEKLSESCDYSNDSIDQKNNVSLILPSKRRKAPEKVATNANKEKELEMKLDSKSKSKSKKKKLNDEMTNKEKEPDMKLDSKSKSKSKKKKLNDEMTNKEKEPDMKLDSKSKSKSKGEKLNDEMTTGKVVKPKKTVEQDDDAVVAVSTSTSKSKPVNKSLKADLKKPTKKRKSDIQLSEDPQTIQQPLKKRKKNPVVPAKTKSISKAAKMKAETAEVKNALFSLFQKTMKCNSTDLFNAIKPNRENSKYNPLVIERSTSKKSGLDMMSSSSDEDEKKCNRTSFKVREKSKLDMYDESSDSSADFIPSSQSVFESKDVKKREKKIFFNE